MVKDYLCYFEVLGYLIAPWILLVIKHSMLIVNKVNKQMKYIMVYLKVGCLGDGRVGFGLSIARGGRYFLHLCCPCFNFSKFVSHCWSITVTSVCQWRYGRRGSRRCSRRSARIKASSLDASIDRWSHKRAKRIFLSHCNMDSRS